MPRFCVISVLFLGAVSLAQTTTSPAVPLVPKQGALLGLYYGDGSVEATDKRIGRKPQIHLTFHGWEDDWSRAAKKDFDDGRIPLINWEPFGADFKKIVDGGYDANIKAHAKKAKALEKNFFLDFAAEMNSDEAWGKHDSKLYVAAFRHVHDLFVAEGAANVVWVWAPNVVDEKGGNKSTMEYYPGDAYVDWIGVDGYNWSEYNGKYLAFGELFSKIYPMLAERKKPMIVAETASSEADGKKGVWIDGIVPTLRDKYPLIKAVIWFDVKKETDWRINSSAESAEAFSKMAKDAFFNP